MKFRIFAFTGMCLCVMAAPVIAQSKLGSIVGLVNNIDNENVCLAIQNGRLEKGMKIQVVIPDKPQKIETAVIVSKVYASCSSDIDFAPKLAFYRMKMPDQPNLTLGIGVVRPQKIKTTGGLANTDLTGDGKKEYFRRCASNEGTHLTVWTGKPLVGRRIWHAYYYVPYATESTCNKKDYEGTYE